MTPTDVKTNKTGRENSLVTRLARLSGGSGLTDPGRAVVEMPMPPVVPDADGYTRRSPVQPICRAVDYYRRLAMKGAGAAVLIGAVAAVITALFKTGIL